MKVEKKLRLEALSERREEGRLLMVVLLDSVACGGSGELRGRLLAAEVLRAGLLAAGLHRAG